MRPMAEDDADLRLRRRQFDGVFQLVDHVVIDGVAFGRTVEANERDIILDLIGQIAKQHLRPSFLESQLGACEALA